VVQEDQLSLAIGRDGQNARLAAKLTGWRIDIKSLSEAASDSIQRLQTDASLAKLAEVEGAHIPAIEDILTKKSEGRPLTPEEYLSLIQFVDRVERRTVEQKKAEAAAEEERISTARAGIPDVAFEMSVETLGLADHIYTILTEAEHRTVGELMMAMKLNPDTVLGLAGIGPKSMQAIEAALANVVFPEPEPVPEPVAEAAPVEAAGPAQPEGAVEAVVEAVPAGAEVPAAETQAEGAAEGAPVAEKPLEEIFTLKPEMLQPIAAAPEDEESDADKKKGKKKKKKAVEIVYDPDRDQTIAMKKHKRGDGDVLGEWEE
jgi:N utilization substance protein A